MSAVSTPVPMIRVMRRTIACGPRRRSRGSQPAQAFLLHGADLLTHQVSRASEREQSSEQVLSANGVPSAVRMAASLRRVAQT